MVRHPDVDLVAVCVKVPDHYDLTKAALEAGKHVYTEWPLGANLREAEELTALANRQGVRTIIGLQGRQDPGANYIKELVASGYIGEVLTANVTLFRGGALQRPMSRTWQRDKTKGATTLTIMGGHTIDTFRYCLGNFTEVAAQVTTRVKQWKAIETGEMLDVDGADSVLISGVIEGGATVSVNVTAVPFDGMGGRMEIFGREGTIVALFPEGPNIGPVQVMGIQGSGAPQDLPVPDRFSCVPEGTPQGSVYNVAQTYSLFAQGLESGENLVPDFNMALDLHRLIDAVQRASDEGRTVHIN